MQGTGNFCLHAHIAAERERQAKTDACLVPFVSGELAWFRLLWRRFVWWQPEGFRHRQTTALGAQNARNPRTNMATDKSKEGRALENLLGTDSVETRLKLVFSAAAEIHRLRSQRGLTLGFPFHDRNDRRCFPKRHRSGVPSFGNAFVLDIRP